MAVASGAAEHCAAAVALSALLVACAPGDLPNVTVVLDGQSQTLKAAVTCTDQPDGALLIFAAPPNSRGKKLVRVLLSRDFRLVVHSVGIRLDDIAGFTDDSDALTATKVDDTYDIVGRMPPDAARADWLGFEIEVTCAAYVPAVTNVEPPPYP